MPLAQRWWPEGSKIDDVDLAVSWKVFAMNLGPLEWPLSFFCLGRVPLCLIVGPLFLAMLMGGPRPKLTFLLWVAAAVPTSYIWVQFCMGKVRQTSKYLFTMWSLALSGPIGLVLSRVAGEEAFGVAAFHSTAWFASMLPVVVLKHKFGRRRPAVCAKVPSPNRTLLTLVKIATNDARSSFPSGDAAAVVAYAMPLAIGCGWPILALLTVSLACFASMYWKAHFAFDLAAGGGIGLVVGTLLHATVCPIGAVKWWQPLVAQALMVSCAMVVRRMK